MGAGDGNRARDRIGLSAYPNRDGTIDTSLNTNGLRLSLLASEFSVHCWCWSSPCKSASSLHLACNSGTSYSCPNLLCLRASCGLCFLLPPRRPAVFPPVLPAAGARVPPAVPCGAAGGAGGRSEGLRGGRGCVGGHAAAGGGAQRAAGGGAGGAAAAGEQRGRAAEPRGGGEGEGGGTAGEGGREGGERDRRTVI